MATRRAKKPPVTLVLRLYVAGQAPNSVRASGNAKSLCESHFQGRYELEIVDLMTEPTRASTDGIVVTPTLVKVSPKPVRRVIGNLSDIERVLMVLAEL